MKKVILSAKGQKLLNEVLDIEKDEEFMAKMKKLDANIKAVKLEAGNYEKGKCLFTHDGNTLIGTWQIKNHKKTVLDIAKIMEKEAETCAKYMTTQAETYTLKMAPRITMQKIEVPEERNI